MKKVQLIHNPQAGEKALSKEELLELLREKGYDCRYFSTKEKGWEKFKNNSDIVVAGGDGTVRKTVAELLKRKLLHRPGNIAIMPMGTANNIAGALKIKQSKVFAKSWVNTNSFDVGRLYNVPGEKFFLESFGYGLFPALMKKMREFDDDIKSSSERLAKAKQLMTQLLHSHDPVESFIEIDGKKHSGKFLMIEIMNTPSIGPNLFLSPASCTCDGEFEIFLLEEKHRKKFASYLSKKSGNKKFNGIEVLKGKAITVRCDTDNAHADDQLIEIKKGKSIRIQPKQALLNFLVGK